MESYKQLANNLKTERTIKIYVGASNNPYFFSEALLCATSEYFVKALKNEESMGTDEAGVLRFPEDDEETWELTLFWMINGVVLPHGRVLDIADCTAPYQELLCRAWIMADRYFMPRLQNAVMVVLLRAIAHDGFAIHGDVAVKALLDHNASSALGKLACGILVQNAFGPGRDGGDPEDLKAIEGVPDAVVSVAKAVDSFNRKSVDSFQKNGLRIGKAWPKLVFYPEFWEQCMVNENLSPFQNLWR